MRQILLSIIVGLGSVATPVIAMAQNEAPAPGASTHPQEFKVRTLLGPAPPYVPRNTDYSIDMGLMTSHEDMFWGSGSMGVHLGRCVFSESQTCQQYLDGIIGAGVREGETQSLFLGSLRWQYVNFPKRYSPFWRVFGGMSNIARSSDRGWRATGGAGIGVTTYLHDKVDLRFEARSGYSDRPYVQGILGIQIKADRLLQFFALKLRDFGYGTVETAIEATGTAIQATGEGLGGIVEGVSKPFRDGEDGADETPKTPEVIQPSK